MVRVKRKADDDEADDAADVNMDRQLVSPSASRRQTKKARRSATRRQTDGVWTVTQPFYDDCRSLFNQHVEHLNAEFGAFFQKLHVGDDWWYAWEYRRRLDKIKDLYQKPFVGQILTVGKADCEALGYPFDTQIPRVVKPFTVMDWEPVQISCGGTYTAVSSRDGRAFTFGGGDLGCMGRSGESYEGDLQVRGFVPSKHAKWSTPVKNEDNCIIKVAAWGAHTLFLTIHGNVYATGAIRGPDDKNFREKPEDISLPDEPGEEGKKWPRGRNFTPVHIYDMPGKVKDMDCGALLNAVILSNGEVATWGAGFLGRPVSAPYADKDDGKVNYVAIKEEYLVPKVLPVLKNKVAISVACGTGHLMVVVRDAGRLESMVWACGLNLNGQLGLGDRNNRNDLTPVHDTKDMMIAEVAAGSLHTLICPLDRKGLFACGDNTNGACGLHSVLPKFEQGADAFVTTFQRVSFPINANDLEVEQFSCGENHSMAIVKPSAGVSEVYTWGSSVAGEEFACTLGHGEASKEVEPRPRKLKDEGGVWRQVSGGAQHTVFLRSQPKK